MIVHIICISLAIVVGGMYRVTFAGGPLRMRSKKGFIELHEGIFNDLTELGEGRMLH